MPKIIEDSTRNAKGQFLKGSHWRPHKIFREKSYLIAEYLIKKRSAQDIANEHKVTENAILFWIAKHGVKTRTVSEVRSEKYWSSPGASNPMHGRTGSKNPNWKGGTTSGRQLIYVSMEWKRVSRSVRRRDRYVCRRCGGTKLGRKCLHLHHILGWSDFPSLRLSPGNIVTLCKTCHDWVHSNLNVANEWRGLSAYHSFRAILANV